VPLIKQSGAIVVRLDAAEPKVLLVTSKRNPRSWIFPKGHVEPGETAEAGALREAREEGGVIGKAICPAGVVEHRFLFVRRRIDYFLAELISEAGPPEKGRKRIWCEFDEALERLSLKEMRKLLRSAWRELPRREGGEEGTREGRKG
jgi:8-oxo-dGTP pyrophosphatase MutT (NUDIX family)